MKGYVGNTSATNETIDAEGSSSRNKKKKKKKKNS